MAQVAFFKTARTGGGALALDGINGNVLNDADFAFVVETNKVFWYINDDDGALSEVDPYVIVADANPGTNCWLLKGVFTRSNTSFQEKTIASGVLTLVGAGNYHVDTEGDEATDDITSVSGLAEGEVAILSPESDARTVVVKNNASIRLPGMDFTMDSQYDAICLQGLAGGVVRECWRMGGGS